MIKILTACIFLASAAGASASGFASLDQAFAQLRSALPSPSQRAAAQPQSRQEMLDEALIGAARRGNVAEIRRLVALGANPNAHVGHEYTPLGAAAAGYDDPAALEALIELGAVVDGKGTCDYTPLHLAAGAGNLRNIKALVARRANVDAKGCLSHTPLSRAVELGNAPAALYLLEAGADPRPPIYNGMTPLMLAIKGGRWDPALLQGLMSHPRSDVNAFDENGMTALKLAVKAGHERLVELLLAAPGIDVNDNHGGVSALFLAKIDDRREIIGLLVRAGARD